MFNIELSPKQLEAVNAEGPVLVTGPAGSGKTEVILQRIRKKGSGYFILTHTSAAAQHLREQLKISRSHKKVYSVHGACASEIRNWKDLTWQESLKIVDKRRSEPFVKHYSKLWGIDIEIFKPESVIELISLIKNHPFDTCPYQLTNDIVVIPNSRFGSYMKHVSESPGIQEFVQRLKWPHDWLELMTRVFIKYQQQLAEMGTYDEDDLLLSVYLQVQNKRPLKERYKEFLYVDDIKDLNWLQYRLFVRYAVDIPNIFLTSDPDYRIYDFRNHGKPTNQLKVDYPGIHVVELDWLNYRCTYENQELVQGLKYDGFDYPACIGLHDPDTPISNELSKSVIFKGGKEFKVFNGGLTPAEILESRDEHSQAEDIKSIIKQLILKGSNGEGTLKPEDIAILYTQFGHVDKMVQELRISNIPHTMYGSFRNVDWPNNPDSYFSIEGERGVRLATLHRSKGIGTKLVIIVGLEDYSVNATTDKPDLFTQELLHIGINRAAEYVLLCYCNSRDANKREVSDILVNLVNYWELLYPKSEGRICSNYEEI